VLRINQKTVAEFKAVPYKIRVALTDHGIQFCDLPRNRAASNAIYRIPTFELLCDQHDIERCRITLR
jgi:hypothetical protein